jgi:hypothetical protein
METAEPNRDWAAFYVYAVSSFQCMFGGRPTLTDRSKWLLVGGWIGAVAVAGSFLIVWGLSAPPPQLVHTEVGPGEHIIFVVLASTMPSDEFASVVAEGLEAARAYSSSCGCGFSTVGVAEHPLVGAGRLILKKYGDFDEVDLGRGWFNSGGKRFSKDMGGPGDRPQIVVLRETVSIIDNRDWQSERIVELGRFVGPDQVFDWASRGFPLGEDKGQPKRDLLGG